MLESYSRKKDATYAQIALAWLMHKYSRLVPIPGMYQEQFLYENLKTADVVLTPEEMKDIDSILDSILKETQLPNVMKKPEQTK